jgi:hypothetical protein
VAVNVFQFPTNNTDSFNLQTRRDSFHFGELAFA